MFALIDLQAIGFSPRGDRILLRKGEGKASSLWSIGIDGSEAVSSSTGGGKGNGSRHEPRRRNRTITGVTG